VIDDILVSNLAIARVLMVVSDAVYAALQQVSRDDLLTLAFLGALGYFVYLEFQRPFLRPGLKAVKKSYSTNVTTFLVNDIALSLLSIPSLYLVAQGFSGFGLLSSMPDTPLKYLVAFLLLDLSLYLWHYWTHHCDALWRFHKVHHSDRTFNVTTGLRFHMGELALEALVRVLFIAAFGVSADIVLLNQTLISLFVLFHHTNVSLRHEHLLSRLVIVPGLHRMHHSAVREEHDSNYGAVLSIWDRLFGTLREGKPEVIGLKDVDDQSVTDLFKYGFTSRIEFKRPRRLISATERA
jgi:sterol desaturase/sphingolipid hydroxylase (fatty acid hydroxylase superfamily)